jgi:hypothetical protein
MAATSGNGTTDVAFKVGNVLPAESPSSLTGNTAKYESVGGRKRKQKTAKKMDKKMDKKMAGGSSALAFSELGAKPAPLAPLPSAEVPKQAGGKKRRSAKRARKSMRNITIKGAVKGFFKLFKK